VTIADEPRVRADCYVGLELGAPVPATRHDAALIAAISHG